MVYSCSFASRVSAVKRKLKLQTEKTTTMPRMSVEELEQFLTAHFPYAEHRSLMVERIEENFAQVRLCYHDRHLRPGGTISGASLMTLADMAMYVALLGMIGPVALAVTTNLNINFLRKPGQRDVIGECKLLKLGKRLAVGEVKMYSDGDSELVAHATVTYLIPT